MTTTVATTGTPLDPDYQRVARRWSRARVVWHLPRKHGKFDFPLRRAITQKLEDNALTILRTTPLEPLIEGFETLRSARELTETKRAVHKIVRIVRTVDVELDDAELEEIELELELTIEAAKAELDVATMKLTVSALTVDAVAKACGLPFVSWKATVQKHAWQLPDATAGSDRMQ